MLEQSIKRWVVLVAGILLQTAIGGIYAWSAFVPTLIEKHGFNLSETGLIFGVQIIIFTLTTLPAGKVLSKKGPRFTALIGAVLFGLGYILASIIGDSFPLMLISLGVVTGIGIGFVYVCPLTTGMKWFPNNRGMVTGVAVAGFGAGAIVLSNFVEFLMHTKGLSVFEVFRITGFVFGGVAVLSSLFLDFPQNNMTEDNSQKSDSIIPLALSQPYLIIAFSMFSATFAGLLLSAHLKPFMLAEGLVASQAPLAISLFAIGNTVGRLSWGVIHDKLEAKRTMLLSLIVMFIAVLGIILFTIHGGSGAIFLTLIALIGFGFGACFVVYASAISTIFGVDMVPRLYPISFIGYGLSALIGPFIGGEIVDRTGAYDHAFIVSAILILISIVLVLFAFKGELPKEGVAT